MMAAMHQANHQAQMAMALMQDLAWKPSSCYYCLLQTPIHQSLQNNGKKVENNTNNNNI
jgi:hypothetical protein